jgi:ElaB/YqjD/DUF883 family membrane-anchored ribosome-binding protein
MTTKHKKHNSKYSKTKKSKVVGKGKYYNSKSNSDRDSVDNGMEKVLTNMGIPNTDKYDNQNGWLAISVIGVIGVLLLGVTVIKRR